MRRSPRQLLRSQLDSERQSPSKVTEAAQLLLAANCGYGVGETKAPGGRSWKVGRLPDHCTTYNYNIAITLHIIDLWCDLPTIILLIHSDSAAWDFVLVCPAHDICTQSHWLMYKCIAYALYTSIPVLYIPVYPCLLMSTNACLPVSTCVYIPTYICIGIVRVLLSDASFWYGAIGMRPALISCVGSVIEYSSIISVKLNPVTFVASAVWLSARNHHACNGF